VAAAAKAPAGAAAASIAPIEIRPQKLMQECVRIDSPPPRLFLAAVCTSS